MNEQNYDHVLEVVDRAIEEDQRPDTFMPPSKRSFRLTPVAELLKEREPLRWLLKGYLLPDSLCLLFGKPAAGKSLIAMDWAACIATGREWYGHRVTEGPVIYIAGEGHVGIRRRFKAWAMHHDCEDELGRAALFVSDTGASFTEQQRLNEVIAAVDALAAEHGRPALIVVDTLHRNLGPGDENSAKDIAVFVQALDTLRHRHGAAILVVHHSGHGTTDRARGSSALRAAVDAEFMLEIG